jgi:hypothetical protein
MTNHRSDATWLAAGMFGYGLLTILVGMDWPFILALVYAYTAFVYHLRRISERSP